ncbi:MAG: PD-(D/E)XK nuclease family protein [Phycisphaerae bacterium]
MPVRFVLGRAGTGKTRHCLAEVVEALRDPADQSARLLLVPEQATFQMERAIAALSGGYARAEVLSFSRLAQRVLGEWGSALEPLSHSARGLALRRVCARNRDAAAGLGNSGGGGFIRQLDRIVAELLREGVSPAQLARAAAGIASPESSRRVAALGRLYGDYLAWLGPSRLDSAQRLSAMRGRFEQTGWLCGARIWVDGFAGFTGEELSALAALARLCRHVTITLLADPASGVIESDLPSDPLALFHETEKTFRRLRDLLCEAGVPIETPLMLTGAPPRFVRAPGLACLEAHFAGAPMPVPPRRDDIRVIRCATHREELREAASFIRREVGQPGRDARYRSFALIARDLTAFAPLVAEVLSEFQVPYFLDQRRSMRGHALAHLIDALLESVRRDLHPQAALRLLRSGLMPAKRWIVEHLDCLLVRHEFRGLTAWRRADWPALTRSGQRPLPELPALATPLRALRGRVVSAVELLSDLARRDPPPSAAKWAIALEAALEALRVRRHLDYWIREAREDGRLEAAETHRLAWEAWARLLRDIHDVLGDEPLTLDALSDAISQGLSDVTLGLAPTTLDQVLVSSIERSRHPDIRHAWLFAFNEGVFPAPPTEDALLPTADREALQRADVPALTPRRDAVFDERLLAYIAMTRPSRSLTISYAATDAGEARFASPLLAEIRPLATEIEANPDAPPTTLDELVRCEQRAEATPDSAFAGNIDALGRALSADDAVAERLRHLRRGRDYKNKTLPCASAQPEASASPAWYGSISELRTFIECPFKHFAERRLRLTPNLGPPPRQVTLGNWAHALLAAATRGLIAKRLAPRELNEEQAGRFFDDAARELTRAMRDEQSSGDEIAYLLDLASKRTRDVWLAHVDRWRLGAFTPLTAEQKFAATALHEGVDPLLTDAFNAARRPDLDDRRTPLDGASSDTHGLSPTRDLDAWPALTLVDDDGRRFLLRGYIDRIDSCETPDGRLLLIYDYKSSDGPWRSYLVGAHLQLFAYAQAAAAFGDGHVGGVLVAPLYARQRIGAFSQPRGAQDESERRMRLVRPNGRFDSVTAEALDFTFDARHAAVRRKEPVLPISPVAYIRKKVDGCYASASDVRVRREIDARLEQARQTIGQAAGGVVAGQSDVAPLVDAGRLACEKCEMGSLCRFERVFNRTRAATELPVLPDGDRP